MLHLTIACVGKLRERFFKEACAEYEKRLARYCRLQIREVADERIPDGAGSMIWQEVRAKEGARLLSVIPKGAYLIALAIDGAEADSISFAKQIEEIEQEHSHICFLIGGSLGLADELLERADAKLSFSRMTFPHQLARVILLEQIYRSFKIRRGETYHK